MSKIEAILNIVSIIVLNIEGRQSNIKINLAISCSPIIDGNSSYIPSLSVYRILVDYMCR